MTRSSRFILFLILAVAFYIAALSNTVYVVASPPNLDWHTWLRKIESVVAFTVLGLSLAWWLAGRRHLSAILILGMAAFSALIELGQTYTGSPESWRLHILDVACGALGGFFASLIAQALRLRDGSAGPATGEPRR
ncbi:MAG TPA: hypothetical protein VMD07_02690 [Candidatus Acidoferrales bacterium]|nr:hypothetical protein [Candidatus Acidoferrales bacterium]